jgi:hypothetical protein
MLTEACGFSSRAGDAIGVFKAPEMTNIRADRGVLTGLGTASGAIIDDRVRGLLEYRPTSRCRRGSAFGELLALAIRME